MMENKNKKKDEIKEKNCKCNEDCECHNNNSKEEKKCECHQENELKEECHCEDVKKECSVDENSLAKDALIDELNMKIKGSALLVK